MPDFYRQVVDNEGNTSYEPVEVIPDDVVFQHPAYRTVVDESVGRRKTISELRTELEQLKKPATPQEPVPTPVVQQPPTPAPEPVKVPTIEEILAQLKLAQDAEREQTTQANQQLQALLTEHGLDATYLPLLENAKDPAKAAAELGRKKLSFAQSGVNPEQGADPNAMFTRINKNMGLK